VYLHIRQHLLAPSPVFRRELSISGIPQYLWRRRFRRHAERGYLSLRHGLYGNLLQQIRIVKLFFRGFSIFYL